MLGSKKNAYNIIGSKIFSDTSSHNDRFRFIIIFRLNVEFSAPVKKIQFWAHSRDSRSYQCFRLPEFTKVSRMYPKLHFLTDTENSPFNLKTKNKQKITKKILEMKTLNHEMITLQRVFAGTPSPSYYGILSHKVPISNPGFMKDKNLSIFLFTLICNIILQLIFLVMTPCDPDFKANLTKFTSKKKMFL